MLILVHRFENKLEYRAVSLAVYALIINEHFITDAGWTAHIVEQCGCQMVLFIVGLTTLDLGNKRFLIFLQNDPACDGKSDG